MKAGKPRVVRSCFVSGRRTAALLLAAAAVPLPAFAVARTYTGTTGLWSNTLNWNPSGVPIAGDDVFLKPGANPAVTVTYDTSVGTNNSFLTLNINSTNSNTINLLQTSGSFSTSNGEIIGDTGIGSFTLQGGTHALGIGTMSIGNAASGNGTVTITGGAFTAAEIDPGVNGNGVLIQSGGSIAANYVSVGRNSTGHGSYSFTAGSLSLSQTLFVGEGGNGTMNQSGGTANVNFLSLANGSGSSGTFNFSNGATLNVTTVFTVGAAGGQGVYNQSGGKATAATVTIGGSSGSTSTASINGGTFTAGSITLNSKGTFNLGPSAVQSTLNYTTFSQTGGLFAAAGNEFVGSSNGATFSMAAGTHTVSSSLLIGSSQFTTGSFNLSGGNLSTVGMTIGDAGQGLFNQSGGTATITTFGAGFLVGFNASGSGVFNLSGGTLNGANVDENIGFVGMGVFNHSAGTNSAATLHLGSVTGGNGTYNLSGTGVLNITGSERIGDASTGTFNQSNGANTTPSLTLGSQASSSGAYNFSGGNLSINTLFVGQRGQAVFNQTGGVANVNSAGSSFAVGFDFGSNGIYNLSGGSLNGTVADEYVGFLGTGVFNHSGGFNTAANLYLGAQSSGSFHGNGTYALSADGNLNVQNNEYVGYLTSGVFNQTGGYHQVSGTGSNALFIGYLPGSSGTYTISAGNLFLLSALRVGFDGNGVFNQTGGYVSMHDTEVVGADGTSVGVVNQSGGSHNTNGLLLGDLDTANGTYNLSNSGVLNTNAETIGEFGNAVFNQTGGSHSTGVLELAYNTGSTAVYNLSNAGSLAVSNTEYVGLGGSALFNQTGGTHTVAILNVGGGASGATYNLGGPATLAVSGDESIGSSSAGAFFNQTGGTHTVSGSLVLAGGPGTAGGAFNLQGGSLAAGTIRLSAGATFNQTGGSLFYSAFNMAGGAVTGTLQNQGAFNYTNGTFTGRLLNLGSVSFGSTFIAGNGVENDTNLTVRVGQTLTVNGAGLDNLGTFNLTGGTIGGAGSATNDYGGVMNAAGTISQILQNNGTLNVTGVLNVNAGLTNYGTANIPSASAIRVGNVDNYGVVALNGGAITASLGNNGGGLIEGAGSIAGSSSNNAGGIIFANSSSSSLLLNNFQGNNAGGLLKVADGSLLIANGPWANNGLVTLLGNNAVLAGSSFNNFNTVSGAGQVSQAVFNSGVIRADRGGQLVIAGAGNTNLPAGQIQVPIGNTVLYNQGLTNNAGLIALSGGTFDNNNRTLVNPGNILGNGVVRTGGLLNSGTVSLADANSSVFGPVTNSGQVRITGNTTTFFGFFNNASGTVKTTAAVARYLGGASIGGTYTSDPSDNYFTDLTVTPSGILQGGVGDRFFVSGNYASSSTQSASWNTQDAELHVQGGGSHAISATGDTGSYTWGHFNIDPANIAQLSGTGISAGQTINAGAIQQMSGSSSLGALTGPGNLTVATIGAPAQVSVASFAQGSINIQTGGTLFARSAATPHAVTDNVGSLAIATTGSAILDLNNHDLLIDNARTSFANVQSYWRAGYNMHPYNAGFDDEGAGYYDGTHGLISSVAKADQSFKHQVGYIDGNAQNIYGFTMADIGGPDLATNRILVRPVLMGDVNFDGKVDPSDIQVLLGTNKFGKGPGTATDGWIDGDFNGDGVADPTDIQLLLAANTFNSGQTYGGAKSAKASSATGAKTLTGGSLVVTATTTDGGMGDNKLDYEYDPNTGDVSIYYDNDPNITAANTLQHLKLASAAGKFIVANVNNSGVSIPFSIENPSLLDMVQNDNTRPIRDRYDLGNILPQGLTVPQLMSDLTLQFGVLNQFALKTAEVDVPEPTTLGLIGVGTVGLLARRRKAKSGPVSS